MTNIVWLRRDLRLYDHAALATALSRPDVIQPIFIFDSEILARFPNKRDRRLTFIAQTLLHMDAELIKRGGGLLVFHGRAADIVPRLAQCFAGEVFAAQDFEPETMARDAAVSRRCKLTLAKDHLIFSPTEILKDDDTAFKVFTPYSKQWLKRLTPSESMEYTASDKGRYADVTKTAEQAKAAGLKLVCLDGGLERMLAQVGYEVADISHWPVDSAHKRLSGFMAQNVSNYKHTRDQMGIDGTSKLSPYLRFGLVSVRDVLRRALSAGQAGTYINELIWREFYAMILFHYPESAHTEWNPKYRHVLDWSQDIKTLEAWKAGRTGYPVVDAAMRQLLETGWMHNRARMIVASFATKDLQLDWRLGEEHFAQHLMDYELASNVGGWQWSASTGTDAQPWFRIFNPYLQSEKFDAKGDYIRAYVPELRGVMGKEIHNPSPLLRGDYPPAIVDHARAREKTLAMFKAATGQTIPSVPD